MIKPSLLEEEAIKRLRIYIRGCVQGVGFRPRVYRLAKQLRLSGWVSNTTQGLLIEIQADSLRLFEFLRLLKSSAPPQSKIEEIKVEYLNPQKENDFKILSSFKEREVNTYISPDIGICRSCLEELFSESDRRFLYPFINCTDCGPRFTIIKGLPYDRENTTMDEFRMCECCLKEYEDPLNRRFHAQPNACWKCGPEITLIKEKFLKKNIEAIKEAIALLRKGKILAVKGLGGYHLACDATNSLSVRILRKRKHRQNKPFALMAKDIQTIKKICILTPEEKALLVSWQRPIVLLKKKDFPLLSLCEEVASFNNYLGVMLPYTPLHYLLFSPKLDSDLALLVMTSANISDEPIVYKDEDALIRLKGIADGFLLHNRKINIHCDDSVMRIFKPTKKLYPIRRSRGYSPEVIHTIYSFKEPILACGGDLKNTFCLAKKDEVFISHYIGDLENYLSFKCFEEGIEHFKRLFGIEPKIIAYDKHPEYYSQKYALRYLASHQGLKGIGVQHHHAHIVSCLVENSVKTSKIIGVAFDGSGWGDDDKIWGGEIFVATPKEYKRWAHLKYIPLLGGEKAIREPWRMALSYLYTLYKEDLLNLDLDFCKQLDRRKYSILKNMFISRINSPLTSSMGRLFDAVSSLLRLRDYIFYEGQAAIELEMIAQRNIKVTYDYSVEFFKGRYIIDSGILILEIVKDIIKGMDKSIISAKFHNTIAKITIDICKKIYKQEGLREVILSGGVFQNTYLTEIIYQGLKKEGFIVYLHRRLPPNDGGICLGQAVIARAKL